MSHQQWAYTSQLSTSLQTEPSCCTSNYSRRANCREQKLDYEELQCCALHIVKMYIVDLAEHDRNGHEGRQLKWGFYVICTFFLSGTPRNKSYNKIPRQTLWLSFQSQQRCFSFKTCYIVVDFNTPVICFHFGCDCVPLHYSFKHSCSSGQHLQQMFSMCL